VPRFPVAASAGDDYNGIGCDGISMASLPLESIDAVGQSMHRPSPGGYIARAKKARLMNLQPSYSEAIIETWSTGQDNAIKTVSSRASSLRQVIDRT
jgi:hypothetical protein